MLCVFELATLLVNPMQKGSFILIEPDVLHTLHGFRQRSSDDNEAGGILIGYRRQQHIHVVEFTTPEPRDVRSRCEFDRVDPYHANRARKRWRESRKKLDCIGEWHTHPEKVPAPSGLDRAEWKRVVSATSLPMVFAIVGLEADWIGVGKRRVYEKLNVRREFIS